MENFIAILDFGSQYTHLIARRIREIGVYSEIFPFNIKVRTLSEKKPKAIILSGGPASVNSKKSPLCDKKIFELDIPVLGICYGSQTMVKILGGKVKRTSNREYGKTILQIKNKSPLLKGIRKKEISVWMSHQDKIISLPRGFSYYAKTANCKYALIENKTKKFYGLQFHPEVTHTQKGKQILKNFTINISNCIPDWNMRSFVKNSITNIKKQVKNEKVICALSGGVDSSVMTALLHKAIGKNLIAIFIDNGLLRKKEADFVIQRFKKYSKINLKIVNAEDVFLKALKGIKNPEKKRKTIGKKFIEVFEKETKKIGNIKYLAQGTLYPDVIESHSPLGGPSSTIKTHHNVGGLPKNLKFKLIEPFKDLFKDEVRSVGKELGLPHEIIYRHPFPGPGLAVRILGTITKEKLDILRQADWLLIDEIKKSGLYKKLWQSFCVLLPIKSVGVMGDERTYENVIAVRAVTSQDAMSANWAKLPYSVLENISNSIINKVKGVNRVVYDISSKPPSTIEWE